MKFHSIRLLIIAALFSTFGNIFIKKASESSTLFESIFEYKFFVGGVFYGLNLLLFLFVLRSEDVSKAYPILASLSFIFLSVISYYFLSENFSRENIFGLLVVLVGIYFLSK